MTLKFEDFSLNYYSSSLFELMWQPDLEKRGKEKCIISDDSLDVRNTMFHMKVHSYIPASEILWAFKEKNET